MLIERRSVGRKTPKDGRLELSAAAAERLEVLGEEFTVSALGREAAGHVEAMTCTCGKGGSEGGSHIHHFAVSPLFRELSAGAEVLIELDEATRALRVVPV